MSKKWKSVNSGAPLGEKVSNTFRDVSLEGLTLESIDKIDGFCLEHSIARSDYLKLLADAIDMELDEAEASRLEFIARYHKDIE